jgi:hypothetical protein
VRGPYAWFPVLLLTGLLSPFNTRAAAVSTTTTLAIGPSSLPVQQPLILTATVKDANNAAVLTGSVTFYDGSSVLGMAALIHSGGAGFTPGTALFRTRILAQGSHSLTAKFNGTAADAASTSTAQTVTITAAAGRYGSATVVGASPGGNGTYSLSATGGGFGPVGPTGSVTFNNTTEGTSPGLATLTPGSTWFLSSAVAYPANSACSSVTAAGDFNNDGNLDIATVGATLGSDGICGDGAGVLTVFLGNGNGGFTPAASSVLSTAADNSALGPLQIIVADMNGDGNLDVVVSIPGSVLLFLGNGDGTFQASIAIAEIAGTAAIAIADFNGDGLPDVAAVTTAAGFNYLQITVLPGKGDGTFGTPQVTDSYYFYYSLNVPGTAAIATGDINNDGKTDLLIAGAYVLGTCPGNGDGTFQTCDLLNVATESYTSGDGIALAFADLAGNGNPEAIFATADGSAFGAWLISGGNWTGKGSDSLPADAVGSTSVGAEPTSLAVGDFNYDGKLDVAVYDSASGRIYIYTGNGDGTVQSTGVPPQIVAVPGSPVAVNQIAVGDFRNNGNFDLVVTDAANNNIDLLEPASTATAALSNVAITGTGAQRVDASYSGDTNYNASTSAPQTVDPAAAAATVSIGTNLGSYSAVVAGTPVTLTVMVTGSGATPTGAVRVSLNALAGGAELTLSDGSAQYTTAVLPPGQYTATAQYEGDSNYTSATATAPLSVLLEGYVGMTALVSGPASVPIGTPIPIVATLTPQALGPSPTGTVSLLNGATTIATAPLSGNPPFTLNFSVNTPTQPLAIGTYDFFVMYGGDSHWGGYGVSATQSGVAGAAVITVTQGSTTTTVASSAATATAGTNVTLTAMINTGLTTPAPTGTVQFYDGTTALGSPVALAGGSASYSTSTLALGTHSITAVYSGDANFMGSTSAATGAVLVTVVQAIGSCTTANPNPNPNPASFAAVGDFNGDCRSDILWRNTSTQQVYEWFMNGATYSGSGSPGSPTSNWVIQGAGDFDGDGKADILWRNSTTGEVYIWLMNGSTFTNSGSLGYVSSDWGIQGVGDFNGDGKADILWRNSTTGQVYLWFISGTTMSSGGSVTYISSDWVIHGIGDFNGDGDADILWRNSTTGEVYIWLMNGTTLTSSGSLGYVSSDWSIQGVGDFNGNGTSDILWRNSGTGQVYVWYINGTTMTGGGSVTYVSSAWVIDGLGDYDGSGRAGILWRNTSTEQVYIWLMNGATLTSSGSPGAPDATWQIAP